MIRILLILLLAITATAQPAFQDLVDNNLEQTIADRKWFHTNPELSGEEFNTQIYLRNAISNIPGVELIEGDWGTGLVAILHGQPGPLIAWRADTDALPIQEETGLSYSSQFDGVMHACGHDLHMSVALGAMRVISDIRNELPGSILWIFQPAEEIGAGALQMIEAGVFNENRMPECVLALHDHPTFNTGEIGSCSGYSTANVDAVRITVNGRSGHGAYPHKAIDPVTIAAQIVLGLNSIVARQIDVNTHAVISVGKIEGGTKSNIIPSSVTMEATIRTHDQKTREEIQQQIRTTCLGIASASQAPEPDLEFFYGTPGGYNNPELVSQCREVFARILGPENDQTYPPGMGGEDFSRFGQVVPGFQFRLGVAPEGKDMTLHNSKFYADEKSIGIGMRVVSELLFDQLNRR
ncbi:amidohydrolase [bacterium]|jgi:amidohydrolase|nr:amidohydrolase [bacterium]